MDHLLEASRRALKSICTAEEVYIIVPSISDVFPLDLNENQGDGKGHGVNVNEGKEEEKKFYTLDSERPLSQLVRFEMGDLELAALQSLRFHCLPVDSKNGEHVSSCSWGLRRFQSNQALHGGGMDEDRDVKNKDVNQNLFVISVPFILRNGEYAVVTLIRKNLAFHGYDKDCIAWLTKVFSFCLDSNRSQNTLQWAAKEAQLLEAENKLAALERDADILQFDLCRRTPVSSLMLSSNDVKQVGDVIGGGGGETCEAKHQESGPVRECIASAHLVFGGNVLVTVNLETAVKTSQLDVLLDGQLSTELGASLLRGAVESESGNGKIYFALQDIVSEIESIDRDPDLVLPPKKCLLKILINHSEFPTLLIHIEGEEKHLKTKLLKLRLALLLRCLDFKDLWSRVQERKEIIRIGQECDASLTEAKESYRIGSQVHRVNEAILGCALNTGRVFLKDCFNFLKHCSVDSNMKEFVATSLCKSCRSMSLVARGWDFFVGAVERDSLQNTSCISAPTWIQTDSSSPTSFLISSDSNPLKIAINSGKVVIIGRASEVWSVSNECNLI